MFCLELKRYDANYWGLKKPFSCIIYARDGGERYTYSREGRSSVYTEMGYLGEKTNHHEEDLKIRGKRY